MTVGELVYALQQMPEDLEVVFPDYRKVTPNYRKVTPNYRKVTPNYRKVTKVLRVVDPTLPKALMETVVITDDEEE